MPHHYTYDLGLPLVASTENFDYAQESEGPRTDSALKTQVAGKHYKDFKIQPVEYINANDLDFLQGNVIKYITRHKHKGKAEDVKKALHFCQLILEMQYGEK